MKELVYTATGLIGSALGYFFGGVDAMFIVLCIFLGIDYISGIIVALVFKKSPKTESGKADSTIGFKGICKKLFTIVLVGVAHQLDLVLGVEFVRGGVIVAFLTNETISIIENAGLMGIPIPKPLRNAIDVLHGKEESYDG